MSSMEARPAVAHGPTAWVRSNSGPAPRIQHKEPNASLPIVVAVCVVSVAFLGVLAFVARGQGKARDGETGGRGDGGTQAVRVATGGAPVVTRTGSQQQTEAARGTQRDRTGSQKQTEAARGTVGEERPTPVAQTWKVICDGKSLDCLGGKGGGAWKIDGDAIVNVPGNRHAAQTAAEFTDGDLRIKFETKGSTYIQFTARQGDEGGYTANFDRGQLEELAGKAHELLFHMEGDKVSATVDGKKWDLEINGKPKSGKLQFYAKDGALRVMSIEVAEAGAKTANR
ncbi:MAG TPA: hypothetical protein VGP72_23975 [Planctomycetota bacterium]